jgi:hypothetical protein
MLRFNEAAYYSNNSRQFKHYPALLNAAQRQRASLSGLSTSASTSPVQARKYLILSFCCHRTDIFVCCNACIPAAQQGRTSLSNHIYSENAQHD